MKIYERSPRDEVIGCAGHTMSLRSDQRACGPDMLERVGLYKVCESLSLDATNVP